MSDAKLGTGFKYSKIMAWSPAILVALALVVLVVGETVIGLTLLAFAVLVLFYVQRRRKAAPGEGPAAPTHPGDGTPRTP